MVRVECYCLLVVMIGRILKYFQRVYFEMSYGVSILGVPVMLDSDKNLLRNHSVLGWNRNRNQENQVVLESELESYIEALESESDLRLANQQLESKNVDWNRNRSGIRDFFSGIGIRIRNVENAGIGIGIKLCPEPCITGVCFRGLTPDQIPAFPKYRA